MPKDKLKTIYVCNQCGETSPRWMGRCPSCGAWNTMTEDVVAEPTKSSSRAAAPVRVTGQTSLTPQKLKNISTTEEKSRIVTGISELDRVLGGGIVIGSVTLIGGEPGIGKSTILLQLCGEVSKTKNVLYVTGEESVRQIKLRAVRLNVPEDLSLIHIYAPRKKRGRYADDDEVSEDDEMAERIIHWAPPITAIVCALIIAVSLVYHFVLA